MSPSTFFLRIALRIVAICVIGMAGTFATEAMEASGFLGDYEVKASEFRAARIEWGARHIWWIVMMVALAIAGVIKAIHDSVSDGGKVAQWNMKP